MTTETPFRRILFAVDETDTSCLALPLVTAMHERGARTCTCCTFRSQAQLEPQLAPPIVSLSTKWSMP